MVMIQVPILFPKDLYETLKLKSKIEKKPMADFVRRAVGKELGKSAYRSPLLEMAKKATGSTKGPKKSYSLTVDEVVYGEKSS